MFKTTFFVQFETTYLFLFYKIKTQFSIAGSVFYKSKMTVQQDFDLKIFFHC